jgi:hypothetical protein
VDYSTYPGILEAVKNELNRADISLAELKSFIRISELRAYRELRIPTMEIKARINVLPPGDDVTDDTSRFPVPSNWLETITLTDEDGTPIEYISQQHFRSLGQGHAPRGQFFTREHVFFRVWPTVPQGRYVMLYYYGEPPAGNETDNTEPAAYRNIGEALFFGAVSEGWRYLRDDSKQMYWRELFAEILQQVQSQARVSEIAGSTLISKNPYR